MDKEGSKEVDTSPFDGNTNGSDSKDSNPVPVKPKRERVVIADDKTSSSSSGNNKPIEEDTAPGKPRRKREGDDKPSSSSGKDTGGGWMSMSSDPKPKINTNVQFDNDNNDENDNITIKNNKKDKHFQDDDDGGIMIIPDLDEDGGDDDSRVARAPKNIHRKIPTLADLEDEVKSAIPTIEGGFNLKVLLETLIPPGQVQDPDSAWSFETLLRDITDELTSPNKTVISTTIGSPGNTPKKESTKKKTK